MIVIEGTDGVGKTTFARALARKFRAPYVEYGPLPAWWTNLDYVARAVPFAVYSRYMWSAWAYSEVHEQPWDATIDACIALDRALKVRCAEHYTSVLLAVKNLKWLERCKKDEMFNLEQIQSVNARFLSVRTQFDKTWLVDEEGWPSVEAMELKI